MGYIFTKNSMKRKLLVAMRLINFFTEKIFQASIFIQNEELLFRIVKIK